MGTTNRDFLGELAYLYYQFVDYDTTQLDADILTDTSWSDLCVVDVLITRARDLREIVDRCVGDNKEYTGGKRELSISANLNTLRLSPTMVRAWHSISDQSDIISLLVLDDLRTDVEVRGMVGNFLIEQDDETQPSEGQITQALTFRPAARSDYRPKRIYGAAVAL